MKYLCLTTLGVLILLTSCKKEMLNSHKYPEQSTLISAAKSEGEQKYWIQDWDYQIAHPCRNLGNNCITIIWVEDGKKGSIPDLDDAIAEGLSSIATYLYSAEGLAIPIDSSDRSDLANGIKTFYPMTDTADGGTFYRFD